MMHIWSDAYVVKGHLELYTESLIQIEMYNDTEGFPFIIIILSVKWDQDKKTKWVEKLCLSMEEVGMWKTRQEFSTMTL